MRYAILAGLQHGHEFAADDHHAGAAVDGGVVDHVFEEAALVGGVDRHHAGAQAVDAEPGVEEGDAVGHHQQNPFVALHTHGRQAVGHPVGPRVHVAKRIGRVVLELHKRLVAQGRPLLGQDRTQYPAGFVNHPHFFSLLPV